MTSTKAAHQAAWKVFGRGASKTFTAALPAGSAEPGQAVTLTSKAGNVTQGRLLEVHSQTDEGLECWTFDKQKKTSAERQADQVRTAEAQADYWSSPEGLATIERREARNARKAAKAEAPAQEEAQEAPAPAPAQDMTSLAASLKAAGFSAAEVLAAMTAAQAAPEAPAKAAAKAATSTRKAGSALETCQVCNRKRKNLQKHSAGMQACPACMTCEDSTAKARQKRNTK